MDGKWPQRCLGHDFVAAKHRAKSQALIARAQTLCQMGLVCFQIFAPARLPAAQSRAYPLRAVNLPECPQWAGNGVYLQG